MCGRYSLAQPSEAVVRRFLLDVDALGDEHRERYNIAPGQPVLAVVAGPCGTRLPMRPRWGLVPPWAREPRPGPINAKSETVATRPMFRGALRRRRCLVLADGFFEWARTERLRVPIRFTLRDGGAFGFAGLWERWAGPDGGEMITCCILTTEPNTLVRPVHDRMPVIVRRHLEALWLDPGTTDPAALERVYEPFPADEMAAYAVSRHVNNPRNDDPGCVRPVA
jgi:putative SOS response-associated peptidase YedK